MKAASTSSRLMVVAVAIFGSSALATDLHAGQTVLGASGRFGRVGSGTAPGGEVFAGYAFWPGVRLAAVVGYDRPYDYIDDDDQFDQVITLQAGVRLAWPMSWVVRPFADARLGLLISDEVFPDRWSLHFALTGGVGIEVSVHERVTLGAGGWFTFAYPGLAQVGLTVTWLLGPMS